MFLNLLYRPEEMHPGSIVESEDDHVKFVFILLRRLALILVISTVHKCNSVRIRGISFSSARDFYERVVCVRRDGVMAMAMGK